MHVLYDFLLFQVLACVGQNVLVGEIIHGIPPGKPVSYMVTVPFNRRHECGGFLINRDWVITAAQCDTGAFVYLGTHNPKTVMKTVKYIDKKCKHKDGIMLLKLRRSEPSFRVLIQSKPIPFATFEMNMEEKQECQVAGWGNPDVSRSVQDLRVVNVSINPQVCEGRLPDLPANVIYASGSGTDKGLFKGDSGGPLVCNGIAVGVVSCKKDRKCVYMDIFKVRSWIDRTLKRNDCINE